MTEENLQQQIDELRAQLRKLVADPPLPDHQHNGVDTTKIRFKDLDFVVSVQATIDPSNLADGAGETKTATLAQATLGDFVLVAPPYDLQGITVTAWVSANATVSIRIQNESGGAINLASGTWRLLLIRKIV